MMQRCLCWHSFYTVVSTTVVTHVSFGITSETFASRISRVHECRHCVHYSTTVGVTPTSYCITEKPMTIVCAVSVTVMYHP